MSTNGVRAGSGSDSLDVVIQRDAAVPMRDGVVLRADVYRPARGATPVEEQLPTVLVRTSYDKSAPGDNIDPFSFAEHGYAVVLQDVRGRWASEGVYYHGVNETDDGDDTLSWIASQPWSNGKVGMTGISYLAAVQCAAALSGNPHLRSMFHVKAPLNYYENGNRMGGNAAMYMAPMTLFFASTSREARHDPVIARALAEAFALGDQWLRRLPFKKGLNPLSATAGIEDWLLDMMEHDVYDEFWTRVKLWQPCEYIDEYTDVPGMSLRVVRHVPGARLRGSSHGVEARAHPSARWAPGRTWTSAVPPETSTSVTTL